MKGVREEKLRSPEAQKAIWACVPFSPRFQLAQCWATPIPSHQNTQTPLWDAAGKQLEPAAALGPGQAKVFQFNSKKGLPAAMPAQTERLSCLEY